MGYRSYKNPLNKAPLRTVTGGGMTQGLGMKVLKFSVWSFEPEGGEVQRPSLTLLTSRGQWKIEKKLL